MAKSEAASSRSRGRILVVDDSALVRLYCHHALTNAGFEIDQAVNGIEAMEKVLSATFDLVIVDVNMPAMDGLSFVRNLRMAGSEIATLPVLVVTTESEPQDLQDARIAGANFYLVKPVAEADLVRHAAVLAGASR